MSVHESSRSQSRILYIKNLSFSTTGADLYNLFGKYGAIRQIRLGDDAAKKTKGTALVVYEEANDAKQAVDHLNGYHLNERYIVGESRTGDVRMKGFELTCASFSQSCTTFRRNRPRRLT